MKTPTPTEATSAAVLPAAALPAAAVPAAGAAGNMTADPLAALLSFAEQMLARQQPAPSAQPQTPAAEAEADAGAKPAVADQAADLASTLPQALAVALQLQPHAAAPHKTVADDEHEDAALPALAPLTPSAPMTTATPATSIPAPTLAPTPIAQPAAQDPAPGVTTRAVPPQAAAPVVEAKAFAPDADVDAKPSAKDGDAAAPALPVLAGNNDVAGTDAKFSLPTAAPVLRLPHGDAQQWQSPLMQALGDRIQLQLATRSDAATIRLEPPQMGRVDIAIRQDAAGSLQVSLSATHGEVVHQLQQISEGMRWNLAQQRQGGEVVVQVSAAAPDTGAAGTARGGDGSAPRQPWQRDEDSQRPGRALAASDESTPSFALS